jgi:4-carboxymuconolactone decarboxylase
MSDHNSPGMKTRRQVMGDAFVDRALANASDFTHPLQEFITDHAWGSVWQRPGLELKTRSLVTIAMLTALGRHHELTGHLRGALNNGATADEIQEVLLHATVYCGVPLAAEAFRCAEKVLAEAGAIPVP